MESFPQLNADRIAWSVAHDYARPWAAPDELHSVAIAAWLDARQKTTGVVRPAGLAKVVMRRAVLRYIEQEDPGRPEEAGYEHDPPEPFPDALFAQIVVDQFLEEVERRIGADVREVLEDVAWPGLLVGPSAEDRLDGSKVRKASGGERAQRTVRASQAVVCEAHGMSRSTWNRRLLLVRALAVEWWGEDVLTEMGIEVA